VARRAIPWAILFVPLLVLPGCAGPTAPVADPAALLSSLQWPTLVVHTTPHEPFEFVGPLMVTWGKGVFAVFSDREPDLHPRTVVAGDRAYVNHVAGMGWTQVPLKDASLSNRLLLWDLPRILASPGVQLEASTHGAAANLTARGSTTSPYKVDFEVKLGIREGRVVWARLDSPQAREAPFTFSAGGVFPFPAQLPAESKARSEVAQVDPLAHAAHVFVIGLIEDQRRTRAGAVPDEPSESSLRVELVASGKSWPTNPYTGRPLAAGTQSGDLKWKKCGFSDASYEGLGWDGALVTQPFGKGCA
jgi:hypothetical protein